AWTSGAANTEKTPIYVPPAVERAPTYIPPAVEKTSASVAPAAEKTATYVPPAVEKTPIYVPPAVEKTPAYAPPALDKASTHVPPAGDNKAPTSNPPAVDQAPSFGGTSDRTPSYAGGSYASPVTSRLFDQKFDQKPFDAKPLDYRAPDYKPADHKAADLKSADHKPADPKAFEHKPADHKPAEPKPAPHAGVDLKPSLRPAPPPIDFSAPIDELAFAEDRGGAKKKWWMAAAAVAVLAVAGIAVPSVRKLVAPTPPTNEGTLNVTTNPPGARVFVDGVERGGTPLTVTLKSGPHSLEVRGDGEPRLMPVTITANAQVSQYLDLPKAAAAVGQLLVRTQPAGGRGTVDGGGRGAAPVTVAALSPGEHTVVVESDLGTVKQTVTVEAGNTASLTVPLGGAEGAPVSGWLAINAPSELQIFERKQLIGTSQTDRG